MVVKILLFERVSRGFYIKISLAPFGRVDACELLVRRDAWRQCAALEFLARLCTRKRGAILVAREHGPRHKTLGVADPFTQELQRVIWLTCPIAGLEPVVQMRCGHGVDPFWYRQIAWQAHRAVF